MRKFGAFALMVLLVPVVSGPLLGDDKKVPAAPSDLLKALAETKNTLALQSKQIRKILQDEAIWRDRTKMELVAEYVQMAGALHLSELAPIFVRHITFSPIEGRVGLIDHKERHPVASALESFGMKAVQPLVGRMKTVEINKTSDLLEVSLLIGAMIVIYHRGGGGGQETACFRVQIELQKCTGKEKENLEKILKLLKEW